MADITRTAVFDDPFCSFFLRPVAFNGIPAQTPSIKMNVKEQGDSYLVHAELPGVKKEGDRLLGSERRFDEVSRSFQPEQNLDATKASARLNDSILELTLPKRTTSPSKRLTIA